MAEFKPTQEQQWAIEARDSALLVSAAAGSGKTKVLTERLMSYITQPEPKSIDSFLIITFTRAAAGELRSRIMTELTGLMAQHPENLALRRQYALVSRAQIGTIHGFCSSLLREHCLALELSPDFKVVDENRTAMMKQNALNQVLEEAYEQLEEKPGLQSLIDTVGAGRDDRRLAGLLLSLHGKMQSHPYPELWAQEQKQQLCAEGVTDPGETVWGAYLLHYVQETSLYWSGLLEGLLGQLNDPEYDDILRSYGPSLEKTAEDLRNLTRAAVLGWDKAAEHAEVEFPRLGGLRKPLHPEVAERVKGLRDTCKTACGTLRTTLSEPAETVMAGLHTVAPAMEALLDLVLEFDRVFAADKRRRAVVDYGDLEHFAVQLLASPDGSPTELAVQLSQRYTEIMVDEYQDVNAVQELIFNSISKNGTNLFTVGDVKQSIYRFRLADPGIFTEKYLSYQDYAEAGEGEARRILLRENFRSRAQVLEGANAVFDNIMSRRLGELDYDDNARLRCGASYEGDVPLPTITVLTRAEAKEGEDEPEDEGSTMHEVEADYVARAIRDLIASGTPVTDHGQQRPARYDDIAILMRSANQMVNTYRKALNRWGVPVQSEQGGGFYESPEITVMLALLAITDNPRQDVPLISAMQSVYVGFTPDELAGIRHCDRKGSFYDALVQSAKENEKSAAFLGKLRIWRDISGDLPLQDLIRRMLEDLSVMAITSAMEDGQLRRNNLMAFAGLAEQFEQTGYHGLRRFAQWLERQAESGTEPEVPCGDSGNAVHIMSIHKSKGLEFPIVFLCDAGKEFNMRDAEGPVLVHPDLGLGPKVIDNDRGIEYPSLPRRAIARKMALETMSEEMRLLYVAMTRAKEYLFMTGSFPRVKNLKGTTEKLAKLELLCEKPVSPEVLETCKSMLLWLCAAYFADGGQHLDLRTLAWSVGGGADGEQEQLPEVEADPEILEQLKTNLAFTYPHAESAELPSKITATELKHLGDDVDPEAAPLIKNRATQFRRFKAGGEQERLSATEKGTATHLVFQHIDYRKATTLEAVKAEIGRLEQAGILNSRQARGVDAGQIARFFLSPTGELMRSADRVLREFKFSLLRPASKYFPDAADDEILLQGVIDCATEKDGRLTIIDYKTDSVTEQTVGARAAIYQSQVEAYAEAMQDITGKVVERRILYFLKPGIAVEI